MTTTTATTEIVTSRSAYVAYLRCPRLRYWLYEAENGTGTRGWDRQAQAIPLSTGIWCHAVAQGLLLAARQNALGAVLSVRYIRDAVDPQPVPQDAATVILGAKEAYLAEVADRGLELGAEGDTAQSWIAQEQAALLEAFGWAFQRVVLPRLLETYELIDVEREERTLLAGDVTLASRCDAVLRRREDGKLFVWNLKTGGRVKEQAWQAQWLYDTQVTTETLAVERRLGEKVWGVLIEGFDTGARVDCYSDTLKEVREGTRREGVPIVRCQRSRLLYGYKCEDVPGRPTLYDWEGTTRKGWGRFAVYDEKFAQAIGLVVGETRVATGMSPVEYWVNWLPVEVVAAQFVPLEPILTNDRTIAAKTEQIVATEHVIHGLRRELEKGFDTLDSAFPQNNGYECLRCGAKDLCWLEGAAADPAGAGYVPRKDHHETGEAE